MSELGNESKKTYGGPLPRMSSVSQPFWDGARRHRLVLQKSRATGTFLFYPRIVSPVSPNDTLDWVEVSGHGTVVGMTIVRTANDPYLAGQTPYVIAVVELDEGVRMTTNIVGCDLESVHVGMKVVASYDDVTPDVTLVKFRPE